MEFLRRIYVFEPATEPRKDRLYPGRAAESMNFVMENGETLGSGIRELRLNFFNYDFCDEDSWMNNIVRLISSCPRLTSLNIAVIEYSYFDFHKNGGGILNDVYVFGPCLSVMEQISSLSISGFEIAVLASAGLPFIRFKNLTSLYLSDADIGIRRVSASFFSKSRKRWKICTSIAHLQQGKFRKRLSASFHERCLV